MKSKRLLVATMATSLTVGVLALPAASSAAERGSSEASAANPSAQAAGRRGAGSRNATRRSVSRVNSRVTRVYRQVRGLRRITAALGQLATSNRTSVQTFQALVPLVTAGLTQLRTGLETAGAGLTRLSAAVQNEIAPGLRNAGTALVSEEYGVVGIFLANTTRLPLTTTSGDIPDDGNSATANATIPFSPGATGQPPAGTPLNLRTVIRSGEADGAATGDPSGQVGALMTLTCADVVGCDPPGAAPAQPPGAILCVAGPPPDRTIQLPNGTAIGAPIVDLQRKAERTDLNRPAADDVNPLAGVTSTGVPGSTGPDGTCVLGTGTQTLQVQAQFFDLPTSTTPGPAD